MNKAAVLRHRPRLAHVQWLRVVSCGQSLLLCYVFGCKPKPAVLRGLEPMLQRELEVGRLCLRTPVAPSLQNKMLRAAGSGHTPWPCRALPWGASHRGGECACFLSNAGCSCFCCHHGQAGSWWHTQGPGVFALARSAAEPPASWRTARWLVRDAR